MLLFLILFDTYVIAWQYKYVYRRMTNGKRLSLVDARARGTQARVLNAFLVCTSN